MNQTLECRDPVPAIRLSTGILLMVRSNVMMMSVLEDVECLQSDKLQYGLKVGILMKMSSLLEELPNILIIIASLAKRFPSFRRKHPSSILPWQRNTGGWTKFYLNDKGPQSKNAAIDFRCYGVFAHLVSGDVRPVQISSILAITIYAGIANFYQFRTRSTNTET